MERLWKGLRDADRTDEQGPIRTREDSLSIRLDRIRGKTRLFHNLDASDIEERRR